LITWTSKKEPLSQTGWRQPAAGVQLKKYRRFSFWLQPPEKETPGLKLQGLAFASASERDANGYNIGVAASVHILTAWDTCIDY